MFEFKLHEAKLATGLILKDIIDGLKELVIAAKWTCSPEGMKLQAMDASHVALVTVQLKENAFLKFCCDAPELELGMQISTFSKLLNCGSKDETVTLQADYGDSDKMKLIFESLNQTEVRQFEFGLLNIDAEQLDIPDTDYGATVKMPGALFQKICRNLAQFGQTVMISCTNSKVQFSTRGDTVNGSVNLFQTSSIDKPEDRVSISIQEPITQTFALKYLVQFANFKTNSSCCQVSLSLHQDVPLLVEYKIVDNSSDEIGYIRYYLAPKVDDNEE